VIADVSDPSAPVIVSLNVPSPTGYVTDVQLQGNTAFLLQSDYGGGSVVSAMELREDGAFSYDGYAEVALHDSYPKGIRIHDDHLYVFDENSTVHTIDINGPDAPRFVSRQELNVEVADAAFHGEHAYVTVRYWKMSIFDVSDPSEMIKVGEYASPDPDIDFLIPGQIEVAGDYCYVLSGNGWEHESRLQVLDLTEPAEPIEVGAVDVPTGSDATILVLEPPRAYLIDSSRVHVVDVSNPTNPRRIGVSRDVRMRYVGYGLNEAAVEGGHLYVVAPDLLAFDVRSTGNPRPFGRYALAGLAVDTSGDFAYVATGDAGLTVVRRPTWERQSHVFLPNIRQETRSAAFMPVVHKPPTAAPPRTATTASQFPPTVTPGLPRDIALTATALILTLMPTTEATSTPDPRPTAPP
jgi:hypothetical protein